MSPRITILATLALAVLGPAAACNVATPLGGEDHTVPHPVGVDGGDAAATTSDAGIEAQTLAPILQGSPLCNAPLTGSCYPDDPTTAMACGLAPDGGAFNAAAGYNNAALACRVIATPPDATGTAQAPACAPAGNAGDGSWCKSSNECQAGFECVGSGTCQHYCCSGNTECGPELPVAAADAFCDIQATTQATGVEVPVCMPIHPAGGCQLLDPKACPATETCSVVRDDGSTMTTKPSPPTRAAVSSARSVASSRVAVAWSTASPASWPPSSLTALNSSRSQESTASSWPLRLVLASVLLKRSTRRVRFGKPVSAS